MNRVAIDRKWISIIGQQIERFHWTKDNVANCRCFICGDSQKSKTKARGYFYEYNNKYWYKCHNCGLPLPVDSIIRNYFPAQYADYKLELLDIGDSPANNAHGQQDSKPLPKRKDAIDLTNAPVECAKNIEHDHEMIQYIWQRGIPKKHWNELYYTNNFRDCIVQMTGNKNYRRLPRDPRMLLFLMDQNQRIFGVQGRKISNQGNSPKYITIKFDEDAPKLYGLHRLDKSRFMVVVEGPIDSLYLPNAVALCGGDVGHSLKPFKGRDVYVALDNEPRNYDTVQRMKRALDMGFKVTFWSVDPSLANDIEEIRHAYGRSRLFKEIAYNSFSGMEGLTELHTWKRVNLNSRKRGKAG